MADIDYRDLMLECVADLQSILLEALRELKTREQIDQVRMLWASSPEEMREAFAQQQPEQYKALIENIKGE